MDYSALRSQLSGAGRAFRSARGWMGGGFLLLVVALRPWAARADADAPVPPVSSITVHAGKPLFRLSELMIGASIEDLQYQLTGGLSSQLIHGESFFEPSPTQLARAREPVRGFTTWLGTWSPVDDGELEAAADGEGGLTGGRITSNRTAAADVVETSVDVRTTEPAGLLVDVGPVDGDDRWNWYTGYTVELRPKEGQVVLKKATRPNGHRELKAQAVALTPGDWAGLALHQEGRLLEVKIDGKVVMAYEDDEPLKPARVGVYTRGKSRFKGYRLKTRTGGWWDIPFRENDLLTRSGDAISLRWEKIQSGTAEGSFALDPTGGWHPGKQSQTITFVGGEGEIGIDNAGLKRTGMHLVADQPYEGFLRVKSPAAARVLVSLCSGDGSKIYATRALATQAKPDEYQRLAFTLTPTAGDTEGRFAITLKQPGTITVGYAFLQPGEAGRYQGLPVRKDLAEAIVGQGIRVLRLGGGSVDGPAYRWKNMQGPRDSRAPYDGIYDRWCGGGFGVIEFLQFCEAAGITAMPGLSADETPADVADFIQYANGTAESPGGKRRAADAHPAPYRLKYFQVGNESELAADDVAKFKAVAEAVWKIDPEITLVASGNLHTYMATGTGARADKRFAAQLELTRFAHDRGGKILWDSHVTLVMDDAAQAVGEVAPIAEAAALSRRLSTVAPELGVVPVGVMEINGGRFDLVRGLNHGLEMNQLQRDGDRVRAVALANVSQPWGVSGSDWKAVWRTQGNIHYTPSKVWFQPAYYVDQMIARNPARGVVRADVVTPAKTLDVTARQSDDGKRLVLQVVNQSALPVTADLAVSGFVASDPVAHVEELSGPELTAFNTPDDPEKIKPASSAWEHGLTQGKSSRTFAGHSFTVIRIE